MLNICIVVCSSIQKVYICDAVNEQFKRLNLSQSGDDTRK